MNGARSIPCPARILALLVFIFTLVGCSGQARSTLQTCPLPCWYGITPGETTEAEAKKILASLPGLRFSSALGGGETGKWEWGVSKTGWITSDSPERIPGEVSLTTDQEVVVEVAVDLPTSEPLTLGQVVEQYGPPESYETFYVRSLHGPPASDHWSVFLNYYQKGFTVNASVLPGRKGQVRPDMEVTNLVVFVPMTMEEYYKKWGFSLDPRSLPKPWAGFQDVPVP